MIEEIYIGDTVVCDYCNDDYTDSDEKGGVLIGSYAVCPKCAEKHKEHHQNPDDRAREDETFKEFVMRVRAGNNSIYIGEVDEIPF